MSKSLGFDTRIMSEYEFNKKKKAAQEQQALIQDMQMKQIQSQTNKNNASAMKDAENGLSNLSEQ